MHSPVSCILSVTWLAGDIKEPTHLSKRVGHVGPGVVVLWLVLHIGLTSLHLSQNCPQKTTMILGKCSSNHSVLNHIIY